MINVIGKRRRASKINIHRCDDKQHRKSIREEQERLASKANKNVTLDTPNRLTSGP